MNNLNTKEELVSFIREEIRKLKSSLDESTPNSTIKSIDQIAISQIKIKILTGLLTDNEDEIKKGLMQIKNILKISEEDLGKLLNNFLNDEIPTKSETINLVKEFQKKYKDKNN